MNYKCVLNFRLKKHRCLQLFFRLHVYLYTVHAYMSAFFALGYVFRLSFVIRGQARHAWRGVFVPSTVQSRNLFV